MEDSLLGGHDSGEEWKVLEKNPWNGNSKNTQLWKGQELVYRIHTAIFSTRRGTLLEAYCIASVHRPRRTLTNWIGFGEAPKSDQQTKHATSSEIQGFPSTEFRGPDMNYINCF